jgi:hypothetical protein
MSRWGTTAIALALGATGLVAGSALRATEPPAAPPGYAASAIPGVTISLSGESGATTSSMVLRTPEWDELSFFAGDRRQRGLCPGGASSGRPPLAMMPGHDPLVIWRIEARLASLDGAVATIEVRWRREVHGTGIEPASDLQQTFTWRAEEGSSRVLDLVREVPPATPACDTKTLEMRYIVSGPEELAQARIGYDVWLLQPLPTGDRHVRHLHTSGEQGGTAPFGFPTVTLQEPEPERGARPMSMSVRVEGRVMGRLRPDGRIDLAVDAGRLVGRDGTRLMSGSSGRTRLIVTPGETVELQPPPLSGATDGAYERLLRDRPTAIRVRAKRLW